MQSGHRPPDPAPECRSLTELSESHLLTKLAFVVLCRTKLRSGSTLLELSLVPSIELAVNMSIAVNHPGCPGTGQLSVVRVLQMEQLHDKILAKRAETERQLGQMSAAIDVAMRSANAGVLDAGGQLPAAFLALPRFQVGTGRMLRSIKGTMTHSWLISDGITS